MGIRRLILIIRTRRLIVLQAVVVVFAAALAASLATPSTYQATAYIRFPSLTALASLVNTQYMANPEETLISAAAIAQFIDPNELATTVARSSDPALHAAAESDIQLGSDTDTGLLVVTATGPDRASAIAVTNAAAEETLRIGVQLRVDADEAAAADFVERRDACIARIENLQTIAARGEDTSANQTRLEAEWDIYYELTRSIDGLHADQTIQSGAAKVSPATDATSVGSDSPLAFALIGALTGLMLGIGLAVCAEFLDTTIRTSSAASSIYGAPSLGFVPIGRATKSDVHAAEAFRLLKEYIVCAGTSASSARTLLVVSPAPSEGRTTVTNGLADAIAKSNRSVIMVDADFRSRALSRNLGMARECGLAEVLTSRAELHDAIHLSEHGQAVLPAGIVDAEALEAFDTAALPALLEDLKKLYDWVIIDSPALLGVTDSAALAAVADGILVLARAHSTTAGDARAAADMLENVGATLIGVVTTGNRSPWTDTTAAHRYLDHYRSLDSAGTTGRWPC